MIVECSLYNPGEMRQWDDFVGTHPEGTPFHLHTWLKTIHESYGFEPCLYAARNNCGQITSLLPLFRIKSLITGTRVISLPFSDYCGPLCSNAEEERELLARVLEIWGKNVGWIEIRSQLTNENVFKCESFYKRHSLRLMDDTSTLYDRFDKKTIQYSIRKALKANVEIREDNSPQGMEEFYLLNKMTRKKHGIPHQPREFFTNIHSNMFPSNGAFILLALSDSRVIAGGVFFRLNGTLYYKYNSSDQQYLNDKRPNHLLTWHAIQKACQERCELFDFGRSSPCNEGLMRYKEMWGAKAVDLPYYFFPKAKGFNSEKCGRSIVLESLKKVWQRLPDPLIDTVSSRVFKHLT